MPDFGTLLKITLIGVVSALFIIITIRSKRSKDLRRAPYRPTARSRTQQAPTPATAQAVPTPAVPVPPTAQPPSPPTRPSTADAQSVSSALAGLAGNAVMVILIAIVAIVAIKYLRSEKPVEQRSTSTISMFTEPSPYFSENTDFLERVLEFCYTDKELGLTREESWHCADTVKVGSSFKMYNKNGTVTRGDTDPREIGLFRLSPEWAQEEIEKAGCSIESVDCQFRVAKLVIQKDKFKRFKAYYRMLKRSVTTTPIVAPVGTRSESFAPPKNDHCFLEVDRELWMINFSGGKPVKFTPEHIPPFTADLMAFYTDDEPPGNVLIHCRQ